MRLLAVLLACTAACAVQAGAALAQSTAASSAAAPAISDEARAAALEVMEASSSANTAVALLGALRNQMVANMQRMTSKPADQVARIVDEVLLPEMKARVGELTAVIVEITASNYTIDEMHQLAAFYRTPLGQKVVQVTPNVAQASAIAGQAWGMRVAQDAMRKNADELRRRGITL